MEKKTYIHPKTSFFRLLSNTHLLTGSGSYPISKTEVNNAIAKTNPWDDIWATE